MRRRALASLLLLATPAAAQPLVWPGERLAALEGEHLRALVPRAEAERLRPLVARADQILGIMLRDAGHTPSRRLELLVADWADDHNGFSFTVPYPLVQVELAPALPESTVFLGEGQAERTLIHEFAHFIANDRNEGARGFLAGVFGRVLPADLLSLLVWYLSTPAHQTMPRFWQEGLGMWAETVYADPESAWGGRGRDPLAHMVWRLDALAGAIPEPGDWRVTWHLWPYGNRAYFYGLAYARYLASVYGGRSDLWRLAADQGRRWPFHFDGGPEKALGKGHAELLAEARRALLAEQEGVLAALRSVPPTRLERLTPPGFLVGAPAWLPGGQLAFLAHDPHGRPRLRTLAPDGALETGEETGHALGAVRSPGGGILVYHEYNWRRLARVHLGGRVLGWRLLQPDFLPRGDGGGWLAAVRLPGGGRQELVEHALARIEGGDDLEGGRVVPVRGNPWSPAWRPGRTGPDRELLWVETDREGSRLVLAPPERAGERRELFACRGRILHPVWSADGRFVFFAADHTGVANAWRLEEATGGVRPVTHTLGGVTACVPSPGGERLALVDHDREGPFVALLRNDPAAWPERVPEARPAWPAPGGGRAERPLPPLPPGAAERLEAGPYRGLLELRPRFWTPTTLPVPEGGWGVAGLFSDPVLTHVAAAGLGVGPAGEEAVGFLGYVYAALPVEIGASAWRSERTYGRLVRDAAGNEFDLREVVDTAELRVGRGLAGLERRLLAFVSLGAADHEEAEETARYYAGRTLAGPPVFAGTERYLQATLGYDNATFFPTSYAPEDGGSLAAEFRHSGFGGDLERNRLFLNGSWTASLFPAQGHQLVLAGQLGWSDGDRKLQGSFALGGPLGRGLPRGFWETEATGRHLAAASVAWRSALWRPFAGHGTTPFRSRQLVAELFLDTARVSGDQPGGDGPSLTSAGAVLAYAFEFADVLLQPGLGVARQLSREREWEVFLTLGFPF